MSLSSKGYTSSFRGSVPPGAYYEIFPSDFGTLSGGSGPVSLELGSAALYTLLAYSGITNTGLSVINGGNIGSAPTMTETGFPPGVIVPPYGIDNADAAAARTAGLAAYNFYAASTPTQTGLTNLSTNNGGGGAGVYHAGTYVGSTSLTMPTGITLDAQGVPSAMFIFIAGSTINLASGQSVTLVNGAQADNVVWVVGSSFTSVATSNMVGNILATTSVTLGGGTLIGRALAVGSGNGAVSISAATVVTSSGGAFVAGIQNPLPLVPAESTADFVAIVANTGSQWKTQKTVHFARPNGTTETAGIVIDGIDCISPVYPGTSTVLAAGFTAASYMVMNGYLFNVTTGGTTAATFIGFSNFKTAKGATTTDGTVVWTSLGKAAIVRIRFGNVSITAGTPINQEYDLWES